MRVKCNICEKDLIVKPFRLKRLKHNQICCSKKCSNKLKSFLFKGENNHQYGLIGDKNSSFKGKEIITNYGYILEYCPNHPYPADKTTKGSRVRKHRLVIESNYQLFDSKYFEKINDFIVLKPIYDVHHKDGNKLNNDIDNLEIITRSEHTKLHNKTKRIVRNSTNGKIIGVVKSDEFRGSLEVDNPEPSL